MLDPTLAVEKAILAALRADPALGGLVAGRIYDLPPTNAPHPYISLGPTLGQPAIETQDGDGFELSLTLDTWSRAKNRGEAVRIMAATTDLLHDQPLVVEGKTLVLLRLWDQRLLIDLDGVTRHGVQRLRAIIDDLPA